MNSHAPSLDRLPLLAWLNDPLVIARRDLLHIRRTPQTAIAAVSSPVVFLVLMRVVFSGAVKAPAMTYVDYLVPAMLIQNVVFGGLQSATGITLDVSSGLIDRFRSLPTPTSAPLLGRSISSLCVQLVGAVAAVAAGMAVGFRFHADAGSALAGTGLLVLMSLSTFWVFAAVALATRNAETVQSLTPVFFLFLFVSNSFVAVGTLPRWLRGFAANQPISVFNNALRALSQGPNVTRAAFGHDATYFVVATIAWCSALTLIFSAVALRSYRHR